MGHPGRERLSVFSPTRYQLCVVARDIGELVDSAGGWLCDRILAGWDVCVAIAEPCDLRPLQILGVTTLATHQRLGSINDGGITASIALAPGIFENNDHVRDVVLQALHHGAIEVAFWGPLIPNDLHGQLARRHHRLSGAARAFKAHALAAAAVPGATMKTTEYLYSTARWYDTCNGSDNHHVVAPQRGERFIPGNGRSW